MSLRYEGIIEEDIGLLTEIMTRAFDEDTREGLGEDKGGPEGYDDGGFFHKWLFPYTESKGYKIFKDEQVVGAYIVWILPGGDNNLGTLFIDPELQDQGIGSDTWAHIEASYPDTKSWNLGTPSWSKKNQYFYEKKCGFARIGEEEVEELPGSIFLYQKIMR